MEKRTYISVEAPKSLDRQARLGAAVLGISKSELVRRSLVDYLNKLNLPEVKEKKHERQRQTA